MNGIEGFMLVTEKVRRRQISYDLTYMWNLKKKKKHIDIENRSMAARGSRRGGKMVKEKKVQSPYYKISK